MAEKKKKAFKSPSAFNVLFIIIALMAALTWVIPSGEYKDVTVTKEITKVKDGKTITKKEKETKKVYKEVKKVTKDKDGKVTEDKRQGLWDIIFSPITGFKDADKGKIDVIIFVLILGGFLGVVMKTQALNAALGGLLKKMKGKEKLLIPILMTLFAIGGTTYGMQEEAVAFYPLLIPILLAAGYNAMTVVMVIVLGGGTGVLASTVNPFSTGIAADSAGIKLGSVILPQLIIFVLGLIASIAFTMRYAAKVKAGEYKEDEGGKTKYKALDLEAIPEYTGARKGIVFTFAITFVLMILSLIPWEDFGIKTFLNLHNSIVSLPIISTILGASHNVQFGWWYFNEISALFLLSTIIIALIYRKEFKKEGVSIVDTFIAGVADLLSVALIIAVAAAVGVIMNQGGIQDTVVHWGEEMLTGVSGGVFGVLAYIFYIPMSFLIPSSSGLAGATMPIIAPIARGVKVDPSIAVVAFATASGLLNMIAPTIASLMAGLTLAGVSYKKYLKRVAPLMVVFVIISIITVFVMGAVL